MKQTSFFSNTKTMELRNYEAIFFGSDEIWNFQNHLIGKDLFYFGDGLYAKNLLLMQPVLEYSRRNCYSRRNTDSII